MNNKIYNAFEELPEYCLEFLRQCGERRYFYGPSWFRNFAETAVECNASLKIYSVESGDNNPVVKAMLFMRTPAGQNGSMLSGRSSGQTTLSSLTSHQSVYFSPLLVQGISEVETSELLNKLAEAVCTLDNKWSVIEFSHLNGEMCSLEMLEEAFCNAGMLVRRYIHRPNIYERINSCKYSDYLSRRPSIVRNTYCRKARKLNKSTDVELKIIFNEKELDKGISDYREIRGNSWKEPEPFPEHTTGLIKACAAAGSLRLGILYVDGVPVATQLWIVTDGKATIYKLHYDQKYHKQSVGTVLTLNMFEYMIEKEKVREVDFGVGNEPAKLAWLSEERSLSGMLVISPLTLYGLVTLLRYETSQVLGYIKKALKGLPYPSKFNALSLPVFNKIVKK